MHQGGRKSKYGEEMDWPEGRGRGNSQAQKWEIALSSKRGL